MIDAGTLSVMRALWVELRPIWEADLAKCHAALEDETDPVKTAGLRARAKAVRSYLSLPDDLANKLELEKQSKKENAPHGSL